MKKYLKQLPWVHFKSKAFCIYASYCRRDDWANSTELKGKLVKIADEHEDVKTQIQVADATNLGNSVPLQNYANVNELEAAIMTLGNADIMVTFLNAENTNLVKLFSREMNAAASVFKARHC